MASINSSMGMEPNGVFARSERRIDRVSSTSSIASFACNHHRPPSVLYYHPLTESLAVAIAKRCEESRQNSDDGKVRHAVELKKTIRWGKFADGWPNLFIDDVRKDCAGRDVIFLGTLHTPEIVFEQISIVYSLPRYLARSITFILPYFPTATMERVDEEGAVATASTLARILSGTPLSARGPCQLVIYDIHALQERFYFFDNIIPRSLITNWGTVERGIGRIAKNYYAPLGRET